MLDDRLDHRKVTASRTVYLRHCVRISLRKRLPRLIGLVAVSAPLLLAIRLPPGVMVLCVALAACLWAACTAWDSWRRHSQD
ncbi:hypothetical protein [Deinococcus sp.]|uniref:hypothetical protein n=1 Tax=Deinococcus sp. TaxID=47478 RepID=UPI0025EA6061|nr:hypothetical protein [Deinococcus sp.]